LRSVGVFSNRFLLRTVLPFPFIVWGADEFRRLLLRRRAARA